MNLTRRDFNVAGLGALGALAGCSTAVTLPAPSIPPPPPAVRVGDRWRYERINLYNGMRLGQQSMRVAAVSPQVIVEITGDSGADAQEVHSSPWNVIREPAYGRVQVFEAPCPLLPARLEPGAQATYGGRYSVPGDDWRYQWSVRVDARNWERVQVPAGSFDALRVTRRIAFTHPDLFRTDATRIETLWYSPRVNRWVRREWTGSYRVPGYPPTRNREDWIAWELVEYAPALS